MSATLHLLLIALAACIVSACDTTPVRGERGQDGGDTGAQSGNVEVIPLEDSTLESGPGAGRAPRELFAAIEADLRKALDGYPPFRQTAYLDAARKLIDAGRFPDAEAVLTHTHVGGLAPELRVRKQLLGAEIHFERDDLDRARRLAERSLRAPNADPADVSRALDLKARIDLLQGRPLDAARAWVRRDTHLVDPEAVADNHARIWYALGHLSELDLQLAGQVGTGDALRGWLDLAILYLEFGMDRYGLRAAVSRWRDANAHHPAADFAARILGPPRPVDVHQVALLLPLSSNFGAAAQTVYSGFDAAHRSDSDPARPRVDFYDVGGEPDLAGNYVGVAAADGADVIVGPLGKSAVNALVESRQTQKPILMLGNASTDQPLSPASYQFGLAPEPEAQQAAELMYASGHRRVGILYPDDQWGRRIFSAFVDRWEALGGRLAESQSYAPEAGDFTVPIKKLFNLVESENREALVEARSGLPLHFDARRRRDVDALFMAARPDQARLLKPQINFFQGHDLPVYSTSHVYAGTPDAVNDTDLDGIIFPDMPWALSNTARVKRMKTELANEGFKDVSTELFAFGFDAYHLALAAANPDSTGNSRLSGLTSELIIRDRGRVSRRLQWARFKGGVPVRIWERQSPSRY